MKIPKKVKVGGVTYKVEITDKLYGGRREYSAEISYNEVTIKISPNAPAKMQTDFLHELCHAMFWHLGYTEHDEKKIDELANVIYMVIQDNPDMFIKDVAK